MRNGKVKQNFPELKYLGNGVEISGKCSLNISETLRLVLKDSFVYNEMADFAKSKP